MLAAREQKRVDDALAVHRGAAGAFQFGVEEAEIEHRVVRDKRWSSPRNAMQFLDLCGEQRLVLEELDRQAVNLEGLFRHVAFRIEVAVKRLAGRKPIDELDAADFDHAIALEGIKAGGFGIEDNLAHRNS